MIFYECISFGTVCFSQTPARWNILFRNDIDGGRQSPFEAMLSSFWSNMMVKNGLFAVHGLSEHIFLA